jgi:hypothetical protein
MKTLTDAKRKQYGLRKVRFYRLVKGSDIVTSVPPKIMGFEHMVEPTMITDGGEVVLRVANGDVETDVLKLFTTLKSEKDLMDEKAKSTKTRKHLDDYEGAVDDDTEEESDGEDDIPEDDDEAQAKYNNLVAKIPKALRDHMPDFYLKPLFKVKGITCGSLRVKEPDANDTNDDDDELDTVEESKGAKRFRKRAWVPKVFRRQKNTTEPPVSITYF